MDPVNVLNMSPEEVKVFLDSFDHVFSDCDGVLWTPEPLPGVSDFFDLMEKQGKTVNFVSNNSLRSKSNYEDLFKRAGIKNGAKRLLVPSIAIAEYLKSLKFNKKVYCITATETINVLESYGFECEHGPKNIDVDDYETYFLPFLEDDESIGAVVLDSDFGVNLAKLYRARTYLSRPDVLFISGASERTTIFKAGRFDAGPGLFIDTLEELLNRKAMSLGKPSKHFGEAAMRKAGVTTDPSRVLFIGDMIIQDVGVGKATGFKTLLVLTHLSEAEMKASPVKPDYYAPSLNSMVPKLTS